MLNQEEADNRGPAVVIEGNPIEGYKLIGPFETIDMAVDWCKNYSLPGILGVASQSIMLLDKPDYRNEPELLDGFEDNNKVKIPNDWPECLESGKTRLA